MTGALDSLRHFFLVLVRGAGDATGQNLALFVDELQQEVGILIVDILDTEFFETAIFLTLGLHSDRGQVFDFGLVSHNTSFLYWLDIYASAGASAASAFLARFFSL